MRVADRAFRLLPALAACFLVAVPAERALAAAGDGQMDPAGSLAAVAATSDRAASVQDVRTLPVLKPWQPGDPIPVRPNRVIRPVPDAAATVAAEPPQPAVRTTLLPSVLSRRFAGRGHPVYRPVAS